MYPSLLLESIRMEVEIVSEIDENAFNASADLNSIGNDNAGDLGGRQGCRNF